MFSPVLTAALCFSPANVFVFAWFFFSSFFLVVFFVVVVFFIVC